MRRAWGELICVCAAALALAGATRADAPPLTGEVIGHSVGGRELRVVRVGDPQAPRKILIVGCIHGNERAGLAITAALRRVSPPPGVQLLVLDELNPDGCARRTRGNA